MAADGRSRGWCFTINNPVDEDFKIVEQVECRYITYGKEEGEERKTPHLQGYVVFTTFKSLKQVKKLLPRAHLEPQKGTFEQAIMYCHKEDKEPYERGDKPKNSQKAMTQSKEEKYKETVDAAKAARFDDIAPDMYLRFYNTIKNISKDHMQKPQDATDTTGVWYYGLAGAGKSRRARVEHPNAYFKMANKWWDGYQDEPAVIIDDVDPNHKCLGHHLKIWGDRYSFLAESKGSARHIRPATIVVTSQYHPDDIWDDAPTRAAIARRYSIVEVRHADVLE